ncbi:protein disulfide-isomerase TMX3 [Brachionichthys hirsutus]|uniref:protein disulfide-isomerase TMX3 n=1 Tax=Brachionichthys hirsutus TaxID=412623 RepID=UPI0036051441
MAGGRAFLLYTAAAAFLRSATVAFVEDLDDTEVKVPSVIILNTSNEQYFLPGAPVETMEQLVQFINGVLDGSAQAHGGDGVFQRIQRLFFEARSTIMSVFRSSPILGCFLFGLPLGVISLMCYGIFTATSDDGSDDMDPLKREGLTDEEEEDEEEDDEEEDGEEEEEEEDGRRRSYELEGPEEEKDPKEKKTD